MDFKEGKRMEGRKNRREELIEHNRRPLDWQSIECETSLWWELHYRGSARLYTQNPYRYGNSNPSWWRLKQ
jgi:hypothetical protein